VTHLRKLMLEELQRRNYSQTTVTGYIRTVADFAKYFQCPPDQLGPEEIRAYQLHLLNDRKQGPRTVGTQTAALRFFFCKTLKRNYPVEEVPYPRAPRKLPIILTQEEAVRLIDSASNLFHRAMLMTLYSTGMRRAELCHLKVEDIDSTRMIVHIRHGKRNRDRVSGEIEYSMGKLMPSDCLIRSVRVARINGHYLLPLGVIIARDLD
jgi:integrase/recombinase XerD